MIVGCIAWGSLLWKPGPVPLASDWLPDGPALPIEFARVGEEGELAIVLCPGAAPMPTRWARLAVDDLPAARELLRRRERVPAERPDWIGAAPASTGAAPDAGIAAWAAAHGLDAVVWTAMPPQWNDVEGRVPTADEAVAYLERLAGGVREHAEHYVRQVPAVIRTAHRIEIERRLGWSPSGPPPA